jgi:ketosteroid isomerase-like protein
MKLRIRLSHVVIAAAIAGLLGIFGAAQQLAAQQAAKAPQAEKPAPTAAGGATAPAVEPPEQGTVAQDAVPELTPLQREILQATDNLVAAFNEGSVARLQESFLPDGELIDEKGNLHVGQEELNALAKTYFEKFPGAQTQATVESIRQVGDLVLADGSRIISTKDGESFSSLRFAAIWKKTDKGYRLASFRDFSEAQPLTPHEALDSIQWILGEWINEGNDAKVELAFRWSDDENFILGDISIRRDDAVVARSTQRIAYDASKGALRSWTFDSDGGFGQSEWEPGEIGWGLQSSAVSPDGSTGTATMSIIPIDQNRFMIRVTNRVSEGQEESDYEYNVVKKPPIPKK